MSIVLFLLLLLIMVILFTLVVISKSKVLLRGNYLRRSWVKWIFILYCTLLGVSVAVFYLIPDKGFLSPLSDRQIDEELKRSQDMLQVAKEHRLDKTPGIHLLGKKNIIYTGKELELVSPHGNDLNLQIIVERKDEQDDTIEAFCYAGKNLLNNMDFSERIKSPQMELSGKKLQIKKPDPYEIRLSRFEKDFTVTQFLDQSSRYLDHGPSMMWQQSVLYLRIPSDVQIKDTGLDIQFIGAD
ncbi:hypothetical protein [Candidatus Formimonas warabiya]|uniref:Uncharacterized protein n=1 Tax=Formimonas warabiya TaxID=1761012 RepID=A0A3G1L0D4_FORW1|nr:hypothetical protein [Candidatus Formimonas warabiya]ATW28099.1 hypothetical protein DCMF_28095 [Candidatus Formimonas warabiya]